MISVQPPTWSAGSSWSPQATSTPDRTSATFTGHLEAAQSSSSPEASADHAISAALKPVLQALESVDHQAASLQSAAEIAQTAGAALSPGDMIMLSMRCNEFLFHCELTSNIANRSSDGLQQLFKEQG